MKVYGVPQNSYVASVIAKLEEIAAANKCQLSRWQTNSTAHGWPIKITYAVHRGERTTQSAQITAENLIASVELTHQEGHTERSEAGQELTKLLRRCRHEFNKEIL